MDKRGSEAVVRIRPMSGRIPPPSSAVKRKPSVEEANAQADEELQKIIDGIITEEYLVKVTGGNADLSGVDRVQLQVNTFYQSLLDLAQLLPSLRHLTLDSSTVSSVRDLGVGLRHLQSLSLNDCGLSDIDGIGVLTGLIELSLCDNAISDVAPLAMHENIQVRPESPLLYPPVLPRPPLSPVPSRVASPVAVWS